MQLFFGTLSLILMGVRYQNDNRAKFLMSGSPGIKLGMWALFNVMPFFLPNNVVLAYGYLARIGSVGFLLIQILLLLDFVLRINETWVAAAEEDDRHYPAMFGVTVGCYLACLAFICVLPANSTHTIFVGSLCVTLCNYAAITAACRHLIGK
jgi:serine incorporator 1/3